MHNFFLSSMRYLWLCKLLQYLCPASFYSTLNEAFKVFSKLYFSYGISFALPLIIHSFICLQFNAQSIVFKVWFVP
jgi:hypothetical protein